VTVTAWHNNPELKAEVLARMIAHREADEIVQGYYQNAADTASGYNGCLIGCTLPHLTSQQRFVTGWHERVAQDYAIPTGVGFLLDCIFEGLPRGAHAAFAVDSIEAIPVGADLGQVPTLLIAAMLDESPERDEISAEAADVTRTVAALYRRKASGDEPTPDEWDTAYLAALAAPAWLPEMACVDAQDSYGDYRDTVKRFVLGLGARSQWLADRLLELLRTAPVQVSADV